MESLRTKYPDWDEPGEENAALCRKFAHESWKSGALSLPYRFFSPENPKEQIPLVIYLHGADVVGNDNENHLLMHDIGTILVRDEWQKRHPSAVLAPQYGKSMHWARSDVAEAVLSLIRMKLEKHKEIDRRRVYIYGYSAGGVGTLEMLKKAPELFAGAVAICGATYHDHLDQLTATPIWLLHAEDDRIVSPNRSPGFGVEYLGSSVLYETLREKMGAKLRLTLYPAGEMKEKYGLNPHCSWVPAGEDLTVWSWLYAQKKSESGL